MKFYQTMVFAGWLAASGSLTAVAAAECGPPSQEEITAQEAESFVAADHDNSNTLSSDEFADFVKSLEATREVTRKDRYFKCLDSNGDGQISSDELAAHRPPFGFPHPPP